jgi:hypothetical protein
MEIKAQKDDSSSQTDEDQQKAVPYIPPPPPAISSQKRLSPLHNAAFAAVVILIGGFMTYNLVGHQLTRLSADSVENVVSPTPISTPTVTPNP